MSEQRVHRFDSAGELADQVARDLVATIAAAQGAGRPASVVLTGGSVSRTIHAAVARVGADSPVDWARVDLWWGDERFVSSADPERNSGQAAVDLVAVLPFDPARVHVPPSTESAADVEAAAAEYARELARATADLPPDEPWFDVVMLGIGPDGHCASLFPGRPEVHASGTVIGVSDSPKPPPERVSFTMDVLNRGRRVWFVATGAEKAPAVSRSLAGGDVSQTPAAGPRGRDTTGWYVDRQAAGDLD